MNQKDLELISKKQLIKSQLEEEFELYIEKGFNKEESINNLISSIEKWSINLYSHYSNIEATSYLNYAYSVVDDLKTR